MELGKFISEHPDGQADSAEKNKLGCIVSCPVDQAVVSHGTAIKWKSFSADSKVKFYLAISWYFTLNESIKITAQV